MYLIIGNITSISWAPTKISLDYGKVPKKERKKDPFTSNKTERK